MKNILTIAADPSIQPGFLPEELHGFVRTVAEIEWLLLALVLFYQVAHGGDEESSAALYMAVFLYAAFVMSFHYYHFYRQKQHWHLKIETIVMIVFITWVLVYTGRMESPLANLYVLVIITSALTLGKLVTMLEMGLIAACYALLLHPSRAQEILTASSASVLVSQLTPLLLVAYVTTMLSADTRSGISRVKMQSETDELTGIYNMRAFREILERAFQASRRFGRELSILMVDCDNLKPVNDSMGHEAGNRLLRQLVATIQNQLRGTDVLARFGGDEFVVLLPETPGKKSVDVAERIRHAVQSMPSFVREAQSTTTVSIGIACLPEHGIDIDSVMAKADHAMYLSKNGGKNRVTIYSNA
jgi:diguanylate cyclase (GGDEF)-like protein